MQGLYAAALLVSLLGLGVIDHRYKLALFYKPKQAALILFIATAVFIVWDIAGILFDVFFIGENNFLLGIRVGEFPIEELLFLLLLHYSSLVVYCFLKKKMGDA